MRAPAVMARKGAEPWRQFARAAMRIFVLAPRAATLAAVALENPLDLASYSGRLFIAHVEGANSAIFHQRYPIGERKRRCS